MEETHHAFIQIVIQKCWYHIIINKLKASFPSNILLNIHSTLILPYLNYGILAWGNSARNQLDKLLITQKRIIIILCNKNKIDHSNQLFYSNQVLKIHDLFHPRLGCFMYRLNQGELPLALCSLFSKNKRLHNYPTRQSSFYYLPMLRTLYKQKNVNLYWPNLVEFSWRVTQTLT